MCGGESIGNGKGKGSTPQKAMWNAVDDALGQAQSACRSMGGCQAGKICDYRHTEGTVLISSVISDRGTEYIADASFSGRCECIDPALSY